MFCTISIKNLIRKLRRTTIIIRVEPMASREREVVDLTVPSREPSVSPATETSYTMALSEKDGSERERSRTLSPEIQVNAHVEPPASPAVSKGKGPRRSPSPGVPSRGIPRAAISQSSGIGSTGEGSRSSSGSGSGSGSNSTGITQPTTPKRNRSNNSNQSSIKRQTPEVIVIKDEPCNDGPVFRRRPATPPSVKKEEEVDSDNDDDDDDVIQISPFKRCRSTPEIDLFKIPVASPFERSWSPSPPSPSAHRHPPAGPQPFYHPDFPTRPALRCPNRKRDHVTIESDFSGSIRNQDREYFKCRDCPGFGGFICWADTRGIHPDNPRCWCGHPAREDLTGDSSKQPDTLWYKCATDACKFRRYDWDDPLSPQEVNQFCGRQVYMV
ncbi:hypothetical protein GGR54DRAFT_641540 [Hypoxylon sp. NC1633]|nr:hypothetical protein GGR54DRAFT_641540 [Hypoxylon sp. NC1633]